MTIFNLDQLMDISTYLCIIRNSLISKFHDAKMFEKLEIINSNYTKKINLFKELHDIVDTQKQVIKLTETAMKLQFQIINFLNHIHNKTKQDLEIFIEEIQNISDSVKTFQIFKSFETPSIEPKEKEVVITINDDPKEKEVDVNIDANIKDNIITENINSNKKKLIIDDEDFVISDILHEKKKNKILDNNKHINLFETVYIDKNTYQYYLDILKIQKQLQFLINSFKNITLQTFDLQISLKNQKKYFQEQLKKNNLHTNNKNSHLIIILYEMISQFINNITDRMNKRLIETNCSRFNILSKDILSRIEKLNSSTIENLHNEAILKRIVSLMKKYYSISIPKKNYFKFYEMIYFKDHLLKQIDQLKLMIKSDEINNEFTALVDLINNKSSTLDELFSEGLITIEFLNDLKQTIISLENEFHLLKQEVKICIIHTNIIKYVKHMYFISMKINITKNNKIFNNVNNLNKKFISPIEFSFTDNKPLVYPQNIGDMTLLKSNITLIEDVFIDFPIYKINKSLQHWHIFGYMNKNICLTDKSIDTDNIRHISEYLMKKDNKTKIVIFTGTHGATVGHAQWKQKQNVKILNSKFAENEFIEEDKILASIYKNNISVQSIQGLNSNDLIKLIKDYKCDYIIMAYCFSINDEIIRKILNLKNLRPVYEDINILDNDFNNDVWNNFIKIIIENNDKITINNYSKLNSNLFLKNALLHKHINLTNLELSLFKKKLLIEFAKEYKKYKTEKELIQFIIILFEMKKSELKVDNNQ